MLSFLGSAASPESRRTVEHIERRRGLFDDEHVAFFGVSIDPADEGENRVRTMIPGVRYFWDFDMAVSRRFGAVAAAGSDSTQYRPFTLVLDPMLRVLAQIPLLPSDRHNQALDAVLANLPPVSRHAGTELSAPVLMLPRVIEPELCRELIALYQQHGGHASGFMREVSGKTVAVLDPSFKRRQDFEFDGAAEWAELRQRLHRSLLTRLMPEMRRAFHFDATRIERHIVACYDSAERGFFRPHKDNTTPGTAHRRFACIINLNSEEYEGGDLRFPEFGPRTMTRRPGNARRMPIP